ncbi:hypothetical protein LEMLEM_LOCUS7463 [Lemmus lemmus]
MFFWRTLQEFSMHIRACVLSSCSALQMQRCKLLNALSGGREPWKERSSPNPRRGFLLSLPGPTFAPSLTL